MPADSKRVTFARQLKALEAQEGLSVVLAMLDPARNGKGATVWYARTAAMRSDPLFPDDEAISKLLQMQGFNVHVRDFQDLCKTPAALMKPWTGRYELLHISATVAGAAKYLGAADPIGHSVFLEELSNLVADQTRVAKQTMSPSDAKIVLNNTGFYSLMATYYANHKEFPPLQAPLETQRLQLPFGSYTLDSVWAGRIGAGAEPHQKALRDLIAWHEAPSGQSQWEDKLFAGPPVLPRLGDRIEALSPLRASLRELVIRSHEETGLRDIPVDLLDKQASIGGALRTIGAPVEKKAVKVVARSDFRL